jgi:homopolymeric O-antigen transport system ATP-binding protein
VSDTVIRATNLGKRYRLGATRRHDTLRDAVAASFRESGPKPDATELWALRDVSFDVARGDCLGILGRNGAGKSTLLKLLSRITEPTTGRIELRGRVASLLEVGTGFHPELTGRENVFLNGALLGMRREEIRRRFDAIVAFAELERFLDTPVKRYSSGMYMRLAFAIAAHLEPEILIVDEVLAVGDALFQRKCLGKMSDVSREGRTVLFVSHNLTALTALCRTGLVLERGAVSSRGPIGGCVRDYLAGLLADRQGGRVLSEAEFGFRGVRVVGAQGQVETGALDAAASFRLEIDCRLPSSPDVNVGFTLYNESETAALSGSARDDIDVLPPGDVRLQIELPVGRLPSGRYRVEGAVWDRSRRYDQSDALLAFDVVNARSALDVSGVKPRGATLLDRPWTLCRES